MKHRFDGYNHVVRLERGEKLAANLTRLANEQQLGSVWLFGLGAAKWAEVGYYDLSDKEYVFKHYDQPLEIVSLQGNLAWNAGQPLWHIHGSFGTTEMQTISGHVKDLEVSGTCELFLHTVFGEALKRSSDDDTGLKLLQV